MKQAKLSFAAFSSILAIAQASAAHAEDAPFVITEGVDATGEISIHVDRQAVQPMLNVAIDGGEKRLVGPGETVRFRGWWNYGGFIERGEIRLFRAGQPVDAQPLAVLPLDTGLSANFTMPAEGADALYYVLRVYGKGGRFDETRPAELSLGANGKSGAEALFGRDNTAFRTIDVRGGSVLVSGAAAADARVTLNGMMVRPGADGRFVAATMLPYGEQDIRLTIEDATGKRSMARTVNVTREGWFTVAIGDLTLGSNSASGPAALATGNDPEFDKLYANTRGAFYTKGQIGSRTRITASLDTGETSIKHIFSNLNDKDPAQLLRRLDATQFMPTYGDDSSTVEDAPTQGRFYLRVDHDDSKVVLGNFVMDANGADLAQLDRGLYGAMGDYRSKSLTSFGERRTRLTGFASDPGTAPAREEFRGTGGSAYFLERQDLTIGSERLRVEVRDRDSGLVLEASDLRPQEDYDIDYIQGRVLLTRPLASTSADGATVRTGINSGNPVVLVVRYEYTPTLTDLEGYTFGGRGTQWIGDRLRLGFTAQREATGSADQTVLGGDILIRHSAQTFLRAELAQTDGPGFGQSSSIDGGLNFAALANPGATGQKANAWKVEGALALGEVLGGGGDKGTVSAYFEEVGAGFSGASRLTAGNGQRWGGKLALPISGATKLTADYDWAASSLLGRSQSLDLGLEQQIGALTGKLGYRHESRAASPLTIFNPISGKRDDIAAQLSYANKDGWALHAFAQTTLNRDAARETNSRAGFGARYELGHRMSFNGEISTGDGGLGASAGLTRRVGENAETYLNYALTSDRNERDFEAQSLLSRSNYGTLTIGGRTRFGSSLSVHGEERLGLGSGTREFVHSYGLEFTPGQRWTIAATFENGRISDPFSGSFDRTAASASLGYSGGGIRLASALEARFERGAARNQDSWLTRTSIGIDVDPSWRLLGRFNLAISNADNDSLRDAGFMEGVLGFAYRPVDNNRFNALVKYVYLRDTATFGQITPGGTTAAPKQRSQILSVDASYKIAPWLTLGGKYGYRMGEVSLSRDSDEFVSASTHLGVVRADVHVVKQWDILAEARYLSAPLADDSRLGALAGVYRELGDNLRIGVGYSFSRYSDDLSNVEGRSRGWFLNLIGKY